ncbi:hypothetical protein Rhe02_16060 [Rhizocola hellebori]|uniref:Uncharacterized protein n=1 Tax=Rhizocola hellebori TaxID=1392758 RepID=A0A8J3Q4B5_9ACTN|nr:hypothetical protein Rhe02_16060 [Rhizocola hellebori]
MPATAALPDLWGFAYLDNATPPPNWVMDTARQAGTFQTVCPGRRATATRNAAGSYWVRFPCTGTLRGVAHVTAVDATGGFCEASEWGLDNGDEVVEVFCFDAAGAPADRRFTVMFSTSSQPAPGRAYGYLLAEATGGLLTSYNSLAGVNSSVKLSTGFYRVTLPRLAPGSLAGSLQVTAVDIGAAPRRCKVSDWTYRVSDYTVYVSCYDAAGNKVDSRFTLSFHHKSTVYGGQSPPARYAYLLAPNIAYAGTDANSAGGVNSVTALGTGAWEVTFPAVGASLTHLQVTAFGGSAVYCQLTSVWLVSAANDLTAPVGCFRPGGAPAGSHFFSTTASI